MAPLDDLYAALATSEAQKKQIAESNPYTPAANIFGQLGTTIATSGPQYSLRDKLIYGALSGLFGGALTGLAQRRDSNAQAAYTDIVRRSLSGETNIQQPDELPASLFNSAREAGNMALFKRQIAQQAADQEYQRDLQKSAAVATIAEATKNPQRAPQIAAAAQQVLGALGGKQASGVQIGSTGTTPVTVAGQTAPQLTTPAVDPKTQELLQQREAVLAQTGSEEAADKFFEAQVKKSGEGDEKFNKYLEENQTKLSQNQELVGELQSALKQAGETGTRYFGGEMFRPLTLGVKSLVSDDAKKQLAARSIIDSEALKAAGKLAAEFKGSTTDREMQLYLGATIGLDKLPEQNAALFDRMNRAQSLLQQKQDFMTTAKEQGLTLPQAEKAYRDFDRSFPLFVNDEQGNRVLNPVREKISPNDVNFADIGKTVVPEIQPKQAPAPQEQLQPEGPGIGQTIDDTAMGVLNAGARFGNTALFGLPKRAVAAGETAINELGDLFGVGAGRTIGENYDRSMSAIEGTMAAQKEANPLTSIGADIAGAVASPVNKLSAVQKLYNLGKGANFLSAANAGGMAGRAALSAAQMALTNDDPNTSATEAAVTGAIGSGVLDTAARGLKAAAPVAKDVFRKLLGVTSADIREAAKGVSKVDMSQAVKKFDDALDIVNKEHGLSGLKLAKGDETVLQDVVRKAQDSIVARNTAIDSIIQQADQVTDTPISFSLKQLDAAANAKKLTDGATIKAEGQKVFDKFLEPFRKSGTNPKLSDLQTAKKELMSVYKPGEAYNDAYSALAIDFKNAIEGHINKLVKAGKLSDVDLDAIKSINKEEGSLIQLRNSLAKKLPGALAQDVMTDFRSKFFTTGTTGMFGMGQVGDAIAGDAGKAAGYFGALLGGSKRAVRPLAQSIATGNAAETLMSPGTRSGLLAAQQSLTPNIEQPSFDVNRYAPQGGGAGNFLNQMIMPQEAQAMMTEKQNPVPQQIEQVEEQQPAPQATPAVDPTLIKAVTWQESRGNPKAVSPKGATGLMQIMPETAKEIAAELGYKEGEYDLKDPEISREFGTHYLNKMMRQFKDEGLAIAAYNAGPGQVAKWVKKYGNTWDKVSQGIKKDILDGKLSSKYYKETMNYVPSILKKRSQLIEA